MGAVTFLVGAGASRACAGTTAAIDRNYTPPLVGDLFSKDIKPYVDALHEYPAAEAAAATIRQRLQGPDATPLEQLLKEMRESANRVVIAQYRQIPLYLRDLLWLVSLHYIRNGPNFYQSVLQIVADFVPKKFSKAVFLTLNYDLFLDKAFQDLLQFQFREINDYVVSNEWFLLKLHGSANWAFPACGLESNDTTSCIRQIGQLGGHPEPGDAEISVVPDFGARWVKGQQALYPALAAPLADKTVASCPKSHLELATRLLQETTHFCVLGCRVVDPDILGLIAEMKNLERFLIANKDRDDGVATWSNMFPVNARFAENVNTRPNPPAGSICPIGFEGVVTDGSLASFLAS